MPSRSISTRFRLVGLIPYVILINSMIGLAVSTAWIYVNNDTQRMEMYRSVRVSSWAAYQSQLEYVALEHQVSECFEPGNCNGRQLLLQAQIFASRLDVLANSREYDGLEYLASSKPKILTVYGQLAAIFAKFPDDFDNADLTQSERLAKDVRATLDEVRPILQQLLKDTTLFNGAIERRETALHDTSPTIPFLLLTMSGLALIMLMMHEIRHRGRLLRELDGMRKQDRVQRENVARLLDTLPAPVYVLDGKGELAYENAAAVEVLGEGMGGNAAALATGSGQARAGEVTTRRMSLYKADGRPHSYKCHLMQIGWSDETAAVWVLNDAPVDGDAQLLALAGGKMALLGELSSAIAHELNQPLTTIKTAAGNAQILLNRGAPTERVIGKLQRIDDQVGRMSRIVSNIRALAAPASPATAFELHAPINASIDVVGHQYMLASIQLTVTDACNSTKTIMGDPTLLEIALLNILLNARDAFVSRVTNQGKDRKVELSIVRSGAVVVLEITDNAGGIDPELLPTIFDSFVTSKTKSGGMGVGLAISRRSIDQMGGHISATNVENGARFTIRLPLADR
jgi:signal transduction histidine kinase